MTWPGGSVEEKRFSSIEEIRRWFFPNWQAELDAAEQARPEPEEVPPRKKR